MANCGALTLKRVHLNPCNLMADMCHVSAGYNVCIFAYGQTGSGKTHTMAGTNVDEYKGRGINYRALDDLFELNRQRQGEVCFPPNPAFPHVTDALCVDCPSHGGSPLVVKLKSP